MHLDLSRSIYAFDSLRYRTRKYKVRCLGSMLRQQKQSESLRVDGHGGLSFIRLHFPAVCSKSCGSRRASWPSWPSWALSSTCSPSSRRAKAIRSASKGSEVSQVLDLLSVVFNGGNEVMHPSLLLLKHPVAAEHRHRDLQRSLHLRLLSLLPQVFNLRVLSRLSRVHLLAIQPKHQIQALYETSPSSTLEDWIQSLTASQATRVIYHLGSLLSTSCPTTLKSTPFQARRSSGRW